MTLNNHGYEIFDLPEFSTDVLSSFEKLKFDEYAGNSRYRRFAQYRLTHATGRWEFERLALRAYVTFTKFNKAAGGIRREYDPIEADFTDVIRTAAEGFPLDTSEDWQINVHQMRILAPKEDAGVVVPEGKHKDGHEFVFIGVIARHEVLGGELSLYPLEDKDGEPFFRETIPAGKGILLADRTMWHDVTAITPASEAEGHRDTLIVAFSRWSDKWYGDDHDEKAIQEG